MNRLFVLISFIIFSFSSQCNICAQEVDSSVHYFIVDEMPTFNGSDDPHEFVRWFNSELQFPSEAIRDSFDGRVIAYYVVDSTGSVVDPLFLDSIPPYIKAEIERVLLSSPKWTPGVYKGKPVNTMFSIPVTFNFFGIDKRDEPIIEPSKKEQRKRRSKTTANKRVTSICQVTFLRMINYTGNNQYNQKCAP